jgi:type IV pilus assembly protein PilW
MTAPTLRHGEVLHATGCGLPQRGFSLVELLVAMAVGLFMVAVLIQGFAATSSAAAAHAGNSETATNGRYALQELGREIRHAALHRLVWDASQISNSTTTLAQTDYGCGAGIDVQLGSGLQGFDGNPYASTCLSPGSTLNYARGDVLVLHRTALEPTATFDIGAPYVRVAYGIGSVFVGGSPTVAPLTAPPFFDYRLLSEVFFVNAFTVSASESPLVPALYRLRLSDGANPAMTAQLVASNVEHLQIQFGVSDSSGNVRYFSGGAVTDWSAVRTARIWLLMREAVPEAGLGSASYVLGDVTYTPPADHYRRSVYSATIALRNG